MNKWLKLFVVTVIVLFILAKLWYRACEVEQIRFILLPISEVISCLIGDQFTFIPNRGYDYAMANIIIDKSCSGFNLISICFVLFSYQLSRLVMSPKSFLAVLTTTVVLSYIIGMLINICRIYITYTIQRLPISYLHSAGMHEGLGVMTNVSFLILFYLLIAHSLKTMNHEYNS